MYNDLFAPIHLTENERNRHRRPEHGRRRRHAGATEGVLHAASAARASKERRPAGGSEGVRGRRAASYKRTRWRAGVTGGVGGAGERGYVLQAAMAARTGEVQRPAGGGGACGRREASCRQWQEASSGDGHRPEARVGEGRRQRVHDGRCPVSEGRQFCRLQRGSGGVLTTGARGRAADRERQG